MNLLSFLAENGFRTAYRGVGACPPTDYTGKPYPAQMRASPKPQRWIPSSPCLLQPIYFSPVVPNLPTVVF